MKYYFIGPASEKSIDSPRFQGRVFHKWMLPGVTCPICGASWGSIGAHYSSVSLSAHSNEVELRIARNVPLKQFQELRSSLKSFVPEPEQLRPGTRFGPLIGEAKDIHGDLPWVNKWTPLVSSKIFAVISREFEDTVKATECEFVTPDGVTCAYYEMESHPSADLTYDSGARKLPSCSGCGRHESLPTDPDFTLDGSSLNPNMHWFRTRDKPTRVIASEKLVNLLKRNAVTGFATAPLNVSYQP